MKSFQKVLHDFLKVFHFMKHFTFCETISVKQFYHWITDQQNRQQTDRPTEQTTDRQTNRTEQYHFMIDNFINKAL